MFGLIPSVSSLIGRHQSREKHMGPVDESGAKTQDFSEETFFGDESPSSVPSTSPPTSPQQLQETQQDETLGLFQLTPPKSILLNNIRVVFTSEALQNELKGVRLFVQLRTTHYVAVSKKMEFEQTMPNGTVNWAGVWSIPLSDPKNELVFVDVFAFKPFSDPESIATVAFQFPTPSALYKPLEMIEHSCSFHSGYVTLTARSPSTLFKAPRRVFLPPDLPSAPSFQKIEKAKKRFGSNRFSRCLFSWLPGMQGKPQD